MFGVCLVRACWTVRNYVKANVIPAQQFPSKQEIMQLRNLCRMERRLNYMLFRNIRDKAPTSVQSALPPDVFLMVSRRIELNIWPCVCSLD